MMITRATLLMYRDGVLTPLTSANATAAIACVLLLLGSQPLHADLIINFTNGDSFDGDVAGSTAGPFNIDGLSGTITTRGVAPDGSVNTTSGRLGINASSGTDTADKFDDGESWTFDWNIDTFFQGVNFQEFSTPTETFAIQSNDWIGLSITPGNGEISFSDTFGAFTFTSGDISDDFNLNDLSGGARLPVYAQNDVVFTYSDSAGGNGSIQSMTFATPEPGTLILGTVASIALAGYQLCRRSRKRKA